MKNLDASRAEVEKIRKALTKAESEIEKNFRREIMISRQRMRLNNGKKESIWRRTYGENYRVNCYVCDRNTITPTSSVVAHKTAIANGGTNDLNNLIHICYSCNSGMHTNDLEDYKKEINNI